MAATTATEHDVTAMLTPSRYTETDTWGTEAVLTINFGGRTPHRFGLGFVGPDGECRREYQGPILSGPYAFAYGLAVVLAANPEHGTGAEMRRAREAGLVIDAQLGDVLVFRGHRFLIERDHNQNVKLTLIEG